MDVGAVQSIRFAISYFCSFRKVWSSQEREGHMQKPERKYEIATLEEICGCEFVFAEIRFDFGLTLVSNAFGANACQFQVIEEKCEGIFDNIFYLRLHRKAPSFLPVGNIFHFQN